MCSIKVVIKKRKKKWVYKSLCTLLVHCFTFPLCKVIEVVGILVCL